MNTDSKESQYEKAESTIRVTLAGMFTYFNPVQLKKAESSITVTLGGITTEESRPHV